MTLLIDSNEHRNHPSLLPLLSQHIPVEVSSMNQSAGSSMIWPDFVIWESQVGINRKTCGEWLGSSDKVIEQIQRELAGPVKHLALIIEGVMHSLNDGGVNAYNLDFRNARLYQHGAHGNVPFSVRPYRVNPKHIQNEQTRLEFLGVQVIHTYSLEDTVSKLVAFHDLTIKDEPNRVLSKLIKPERHIQGLTPQETKFARQLMAFDAIGEQAALTIAASFSSIMELVQYWTDGGVISDMMMRNGTRRLGNALERKLQQAIGWQASSNPAPNPLRQDTETSPVYQPL